MASNEFASLVANGTVETINGQIHSSDCEWNPHPAFDGVHLKHLITGNETDGQLSCHMVQVAPDCILETHMHDNQWELHEVIKGSGEATIENCNTKYHPGRSAVIPKGKLHSVKAGPEGLTMLAKFFPALV
ncbi:cupin domain-containing protein [Maridesulfovibrio zosterae]|uniref:cupin domain-containing protein n=1 Tax=Maridesulfovibrio zosterae TaxID=82171 RepID=UPI000415237C|nr:cupin domain-containing protein [Maridesulfovibrio zosterae]